MGASCKRPVPVIEQQEEVVVKSEPVKEVQSPMILVGKQAPQFKAPVFYQGDFSEIDLKDYLGKWTMLCFYPGDFTFV